MNLTEPLRGWDQPLTFWIVLGVGVISGVFLTAALGRSPKVNKK
jgi:hypothetical protein